jgi:hypothetical protein
MHATGAGGEHVCTEVAKKRMLVKKGIMTRDLCLSTNNNNLKVNITGKLFKLGSYTYDRLDKTIDGTICKNKSGVSPNSTSATATVIPNENFRLFRIFLKELREKINLERKNNQDSKDKEPVNYVVAASGYADGVRYLATVFDSEIYKILNDPSHELYKELTSYVSQAAVTNFNNDYKDIQLNYPLTSENFYSLACHDEIENPNGTYAKRLYRDFLTPLRNYLLARERARTLFELIFYDDTKKIPAINLSINPPAISARIANSSENNTGRGGCYGYCNGHRGAKLDISIANLSTVVSIKKDETMKFPIAFNSPSSAQQVVLNDKAVKQHFDEISSYLKEKGDLGTNFNNLLKQFIAYPPTVSIDTDSRVMKVNFKKKTTKIENLNHDFSPVFTGQGHHSDFISKGVFRNVRYYMEKPENKDSIGYNKEDRAFMREYLSSKLGLDKEIITKNKYMLNWALIFFWSRLGTIKEENNKIILSQNKLPIIDSSYTTRIDLPKSDTAKNIFKEAIKDFGYFFYKLYSSSNKYKDAHEKIESYLKCKDETQNYSMIDCFKKKDNKFAKTITDNQKLPTRTKNTAETLNLIKEQLNEYAGTTQVMYMMGSGHKDITLNQLLTKENLQTMDRHARSFILYPEVSDQFSEDEKMYIKLMMKDNKTLLIQEHKNLFDQIYSLGDWGYLISYDQKTCAKLKAESEYQQAGSDDKNGQDKMLDSLLKNIIQGKNTVGTFGELMIARSRCVPKLTEKLLISSDFSKYEAWSKKRYITEPYNKFHKKFDELVQMISSEMGGLDDKDDIPIVESISILNINKDEYKDLVKNKYYMTVASDQGGTDSTVYSDICEK